MRLVAAPDKFRGTLSAREAAAAVAAGAAEAGWSAIQMPLADGGEGTLDALGGPNRSSRVTGPAGDPVEAGWRLAGETAVIEMALASGLSLAGGADRNDPMLATSVGTGELIVAALEAGAREVVVGVGGSATTDGGAGAVALLERFAPLDGSRGAVVTVTCDVRTRFRRAATDFGPQKGATPRQVAELELRLERLAEGYRTRYGRDVAELPGAGAAGGLAGGLAALGARLVPGAEFVAAHVGLADRLAGADLVVTGEGQLDATSFDGKVVGTVAEMARDRDIPVLVVVGRSTLPARGLPSTGAKIAVVSLSALFGTRASFSRTAHCLTTAITRRLPPAM